MDKLLDKFSALYYIRIIEHRPHREFTIDSQGQTVSSSQLQQQELVAFLYHRFSHGIVITLLIASVASTLAYVELSIQGQEHWVMIWYALLCVISLLRWRLSRQFQAMRNKAFFDYRDWHNRFHVGAVAAGAMLGVGAALLLPHVTGKVQIIVHSILLGMSAGAIAYLSTSLRVYISYLVTIMLPVTLLQFIQGETETLVLGFLYLFFMAAAAVSVKRNNVLVNDALYYRYDNETLIEDLQRLLSSVSQTNKALEKISTTDELTGISNYRAFRVGLEEVWQALEGRNAPVSLLRINIDHYTEFSARYGQEEAESSLCEVARMLSGQINEPRQIAARLEGAEFVLLLPEVECKAARRIAEQLVDGMAKKNIEHEKSRSVDRLTLSIGVGSQRISRGSASRDLLVRVDTALKLAQERGGNRFEVLEG